MAGDIRHHHEEQAAKLLDCARRVLGDLYARLSARYGQGTGEWRL